MVKVKHSVTEGPIFTRLFLFALPIIATGVLQLLYNMADNIVVGQFSGDPNALGAVGATAAINGLIVNFMVGLGGGATIVISQFYGAKNEGMVSRATHTGVIFSIVCGIFFMIVGLVFCRPVLELINVPSAFIDSSELYLRIICYGIPAVSVYNLCAAILRAVGDSRTQLIILTVSGILNVVFNLAFVILFHMSVAGVAIATVISQYVSAVAVVGVLMARGKECYGLSREKFCFDRTMLVRIIGFGLPVAIQSSIFAVSNLIIAAATNELALTIPTIVNSKTIATNIDNFTYIIMNSFFHAAMTFAGQNYGAKKYDRLTKVLIYSLVQVVTLGVVVGYTEMLFGRQLAMLFIDSGDPNKEVVVEGVLEIMRVILSFYFLCGIMEVLMGVLRGMGYAVSPMIISLGGCGLRVLWILFVFPIKQLHTVTGLMLCYPVSWVPTIIALGVNCIIAWRRLRKKGKEERIGPAEKVKT